MKAVRIHDYGGAENLRYEDAPKPKAGEYQIYVKVRAVSVNHLETLVAAGTRSDKFPIEFPWIPGYDVAGVVESVGDGCNSFRAGDEIYAKCVGGSYAEYMVLDSEYASIKPAGMSFSEAASIAHVGLTAWQALYEHGEFKKGQKVLIHAAAGAVGSLALQLAKNCDAYVYATASQKDFEYLKLLGADKLIDYKSQNFAEIAKDVDVALVFAGGDIQARTYPAMKKGGRLVSTTGPIDQALAAQYGVKATAMVVRPDGDQLMQIARLADEDRLIADVALEYPLEKAAEAWDVFMKKKPAPKNFSHGKIVLKV